MELTVYGSLRGATGSKETTVEFAGGTVREALSAFVDAYPRTESQLFDEHGAVRPSVRVQVNGERADLDDDCSADAAVTLFPAMQGG